MKSVHASVQKLEEVNSDIANLEGRISKSEENAKRVADEISTGQAHVNDWERQTKEYEESIEKKMEKKAKSDKLNEYLIWVQDYFMPTLEMVEKHVMVNINQEFDSQFQKWFGMLVDDPGKQAKIDEEFTPIIQQDGLDQDVSYLSGGEKTSVALAYRLALNGIVRRVSTGMNSNLLILDEPTDGFSKEQLSKVREILDEIQSPQIILVSHERELREFCRSSDQGLESERRIEESLSFNEVQSTFTLNCREAVSRSIEFVFFSTTEKWFSNSIPSRKSSDNLVSISDWRFRNKPKQYYSFRGSSKSKHLFAEILVEGNQNSVFRERNL